MVSATFTDAGDLSEDDPFKDRQHGPRTRSRAAKEEQKPRVLHEKVSRSAILKALGSLSPQASFPLLAPACFPSLDPGLSVAENERVRYQQEIKKAIEKAAEQEDNPFFSNLGFYFGENPKIKEGGALDFDVLPESVVPQESCVEAERSGEQTNKEYRLVTPDKSAEKPIRYKSFVTHNSVSGELVRWHKRATSSKSSPHSGSENAVSSSESDSEEEQKSDTSFTAKLEADHPLLLEYLKRRSQSNMAENAAPTVTSDDATRGMPYYERLKKTLKTSIKQKQDLEETLAKIEQSIWNKEGAYLDETIAGNIMKGFDNYIKASGAQGGSTSGGGTSSRKKATVSEQDRLFSRSSVGFWNSMREGSPHASSTSTPSHAPTPKGVLDHPTPTSTTSTKAPGLKKKKADDDLDGKPPNKRLKITFSRNDKD